MDLPLFNEVVCDIHDAALSPDRWPATLDRMATVTGAAGMALHARTASGWAWSARSPRIAPVLDAYVREGWAAHDPWLRRLADGALQPGHVYQDADVVAPAELPRHPFYGNFLRRFGIGNLMVAIIRSELGMPTCLVAYRPQSRGAFAADEMHAHLQLARHVEQALRITTVLAHTEAALHRTAAAFDAIERPAFILDEEGRVVRRNRAAEPMIGWYFDPQSVALQPVAVAERPAFQEMVRRALGSAGSSDPARPDDAPPPVGLSARSGSDRIVAWCVPLAADPPDRLGLMPPQRSVLLLVQPLQQTRLVDVELIRGVYGLTTGEAKLAALLAGGRSVKQAARELGLTEGSTRFVLNRIFKKLGVHRQSDLVAGILSLRR